MGSASHARGRGHTTETMRVRSKRTPNIYCLNRISASSHGSRKSRWRTDRRCSLKSQSSTVRKKNRPNRLGYKIFWSEREGERPKELSRWEGVDLLLDVSKSAIGCTTDANRNKRSQIQVHSLASAETAQEGPRARSPGDGRAPSETSGTFQAFSNNSRARSTFDSNGDVSSNGSESDGPGGEDSNQTSGSPGINTVNVPNSSDRADSVGPSTSGRAP